jgi:hypothetical protein
MARYNRVKIGDVWLTKDGSEGGTPCKVIVQGLERLKLTMNGKVEIMADGTPVAVLSDVKGVPLTVRAEAMRKSVFDSIVAVFEQFIDDGLPFDLSIEGDTGDWADGDVLSVIPDFPNHIAFSGEFLNEIIDQVSFQMRTT